MVHQKALYNFLWQLALLCGVVVAWYVATIKNDIIVYFKLFTLIQCFLYLVGYIYEYLLCSNQAKDTYVN